MNKFTRLAVFCSALFLFCASAFSGQVLIMGDVMQEEHPESQAEFFFAEKVKEYSDGELEIKVFINSALGNHRDMLEGLDIGTVHLTKCMISNLAAYIPEIQIFDLPYMFRDRNHFYKVLDSEDVGGYFMNEVLPKHGFRGLAFFDSGIRSIFNRRGPIKTLEDMKGWKLRVPEGAVFLDTMAALGAAGTPIPSGDVYTAIQTGVVDGAENSSVYYKTTANYEVAPYYSYTMHMMTPDVVVMSNDVFNSLSKKNQDAILKAAKEMETFERKAWVDYENSCVAEMEKAGAKFNDDVERDAFRNAVKPVWNKYAPVVGQDMIDKIQSYAE